MKFEGPFEVLERRGVVIQVARSQRKKWIHLNRCRKYEGASPVITYPREAEEQNVQEEEEVTSKPEVGGGVEDGTGREEDAENVGDMETSTRCPRRDRKRKVYQDYVQWEQIPGSWWRK